MSFNSETNELSTHRDEILILDDGVKLVSRIWTPQGSEGPWPALVMRQPYNRKIASTITYAHPTWFASKGYLVIVQDVRGQGDSEGVFKGFSQEALDTSSTYEWVRTLKECNGLVGSYGFSYQGLTQLLSIPGSKPPNCIAPAMTGFKEREHWSVSGGAFWWDLGILWGLQLAAQKVRKEKNSQAWIEIRRSIEDRSYLRDGLKLLKKHDPQGMAMNWYDLSNGKSNDWLVHEPLNEWLKIPILLLGGWWDPHLTGILDIYKNSIRAGGSPNLIIGPASHLKWWEGTNQLLLNFFDRHLKNKTDDKHLKKSKPLFWNITNKNWSSSISLNQNLFWRFKSDGLSCFGEGGLLTQNGQSEGFQSIVSDPWRPVPSEGGHLGPNPGLINRKTIDERTDVAIFTSKSFKIKTTLMGIPSIFINSFAENNSYDLCVSLSICSEDCKEVIQLSTGFLRVFESNKNNSSLKEIQLQPVFADIKKGEKLRISIAGSAWPAIGINYGIESGQCGPPTITSEITTISLILKNSKLIISPLISA